MSWPYAFLNIRFDLNIYKSKKSLQGKKEFIREMSGNVEIT